MLNEYTQEQILNARFDLVGQDEDENVVILGIEDDAGSIVASCEMLGETILTFEAIAQGKGYGTQLLNALKEDYCYLVAYKVCDEALPFFTKHGFVPCKNPYTHRNTREYISWEE